MNFFSQHINSSPQSACLRNAPSSTVSPPLEVVPLLGKNYTLDDQCALLFGNSAKACEKTVSRKR